MGRISKLGSCAATILLLIAILASAGCGGGTKSTPIAPTITVNMSPSPTASMNLGSTLQFSATVTQNKTVIATPITFISSNNRVLSFAPSGLACAGSWDASFIVCNPGAPGIVKVIASGYGTPSVPTTVYVHPQVTDIEVSPSSVNCISQGQTADFQATVLSNGTDITPFVGPVNWSGADASVAKISITAAGLQPNQVQVTANEPGLTHIIPSNSGVNGQTAEFETCPVQSLSVNASGAGSVQLQTGSSTQLSPVVTDSHGNSITASGLKWLSSQPAVATVNKNGSVTAVIAGAAGISPVCSPPACNVNLYPVYSSNVVRVTATGSEGVNTIYVTSTGCFASNCQTSLIPIDRATNSAGAAITLPAAPNSLVIDPTGTNAYMGTVGGLRIYAIAARTFQTISSAKGKVLAAAPDNSLVVVSDTTDATNVVYIVDPKTAGVAPLLLSGVTAAAFSPDSTTAYLLAGSKLYIYSTAHPLQTVNLPGAATDASFLTTGTFGFVAGDPSTVSLFDGCDGAAPASPNTSTVTTPALSALLGALPDGKTLAAVNSPGFSEIKVSTTAAGCPPPVTASSQFHDFGQGAFTPKQLLVSSDGARVYVIGNLDRVMIYDFTTASAGTISLSSSATPLSAALSLAGHDLYVGASDGTVHHLDVSSTFTDAGQIPVSLCTNTSVSCPPNLVVLRP